MHIPDGFLTLSVIIPTFIITIVFWAISIKKVKLSEQQIPMMGLLTALFFAAMMMNYPIIGGTTAHLLGGAAIGLILGPFAGCISVSIILVLQAFLFGDGGLTALGANVLNMGVIGVFVPCIIFLVANKALKIKTTTALFATIFISAFFGDLLAAISAGTELGLSTPLFGYGLSVAVPAMAINHSIIGVAEGIVTVILIGTLFKLRPDVLEKSPILGKLAMLKDKVTGSA
jgi:cobalt/nickel transport system permease protein